MRETYCFDKNELMAFFSLISADKASSIYGDMEWPAIPDYVQTNDYMEPSVWAKWLEGKNWLDLLNAIEGKVIPDVEIQDNLVIYSSKGAAEFLPAYIYFDHNIKNELFGQSIDLISRNREFFENYFSDSQIKYINRSSELFLVEVGADYAKEEDVILATRQ